MDYCSVLSDKLLAVRFIHGLTVAIGLPGLRLKFQEDRRPLLGGSQVQKQRTILPGSIFRGKSGVLVALIHMNIVDAVIRDKAKGLIRRLRLRPALPKGAEKSIGFGDGLLNLGIQQLTQLALGSNGKELIHLSEREKTGADYSPLQARPPDWQARCRWMAGSVTGP